MLLVRQPDKFKTVHEFRVEDGGSEQGDCGERREAGGGEEGGDDVYREIEGAKNGVEVGRPREGSFEDWAEVADLFGGGDG